MDSRAHFRILGVPIRVELLFPIVAALFAIQLDSLWLIFAFVGLAFVSILVHELGHALTYRFMGQRSAVVLHGFGGVTIPTGGGRRALTRGRSIAVSLSGVVAQLVLLYLPTRLLLGTDWAMEQEIRWALSSQGNLDFNWWPLLSVMAFINLWWALFNALPLRPLDGGHVAEELFGFDTACRISIGTGALAGLWALTQGWLIATLLMGMFAFASYRDLQSGQQNPFFDVDAPEAPGGSPGGGGGRPRGRPRRGGGRPGGPGRKGKPAGSEGRGGGSGRGRGGRRGTPHLEPVPSSLSDLDPVPVSDAETAVWNTLRRGDADRAAGMLKQAGSSNAFLQASVALAQGHSGIALDLFQGAYAHDPDGPPNLVPATLLARGDQAVPLTEVLVADGSTGISAAGSLQTHLHYAEQFEQAARVGELVFAAGPASAAQTAFETACAWSRAGRAEEGLRWIEAAVDAGFRAPSVLDGEPDLAAVRELGGWTAVRSKLG